MSDPVRGLGVAFASAALVLLAACGGFPSPSGVPVYVRILDADTLSYQDRRVRWSEFLDEMDAMVERSGGAAAAKPHVHITADELTPPGLGDRLLTELQTIGVRSITFG